MPVGSCTVGVEAVVSALPHWLQNFVAGGLVCPHALQSNVVASPPCGGVLPDMV